MIKILIGNENSIDNLNLSQFLANDKKYIIENTYDGLTTFNKYIETKPDILILNSNFSDIDYTELMSNLSSLPEKMNNSNIILIVNSLEEILRLENCSKIYHILKSNYKYEDILKIVDSLSLKFIKPELTIEEINIYLAQLCFAPKSLCTDYMRSAILQCYEHPESFTSLQNIYKIIAKEYFTKPQTIREGIRKSLQPLSNYTKFHTTSLILQIFETEDTVTPTTFLNRFTTFLEYEKQKYK